MRLVTIAINGTDQNPWHKIGMVRNPFPQLGRTEYGAFEAAVNSLDGDPITHPQEIRRRLHGFNEDFIRGCVARYKPGHRVKFTVAFPDWPER